MMLVRRIQTDVPGMTPRRMGLSPTGIGRLASTTPMW
jgi:hypothetical protein